MVQIFAKNCHFFCKILSFFVTFFVIFCHFFWYLILKQGTCFSHFLYFWPSKWPNLCSHFFHTLKKPWFLVIFCVTFLDHFFSKWWHTFWKVGSFLSTFLTTFWTTFWPHFIRNHHLNWSNLCYKKVLKSVKKTQIFSCFSCHFFVKKVTKKHDFLSFFMILEVILYVITTQMGSQKWPKMTHFWPFFGHFLAIFWPFFDYFWQQ